MAANPKNIAQYLDSMRSGQSNMGKLLQTGLGALQVLTGKPLYSGNSEYDQYLSALESQYNSLAGGIESQREAELSRIQAQYDQAIAELERQRPGIQQNYEDTAQQAYLQNMMAKRDLPQQMAAQGMNGGLSESSQIALESEYGNNLNSAQRDYNNSLYDLDTRIGSVRASGADAQAAAENSYNAMLSEARNNYLSNSAQAGLQAQLAAYQKQQDSLAQDNWLKEFGLNEKQLGYQQQQEKLAQDNWLKQFGFQGEQFAYQQQQDAIDNQLNRDQLNLSRQKAASQYPIAGYGGASNWYLEDGSGTDINSVVKPPKKRNLLAKENDASNLYRSSSSLGTNPNGLGGGGSRNTMSIR